MPMLSTVPRNPLTSMISENTCHKVLNKALSAEAYDKGYDSDAGEDRAKVDAEGAEAPEEADYEGYILDRTAEEGHSALRLRAFRMNVVKDEGDDGGQDDHHKDDGDDLEYRRPVKLEGIGYLRYVAEDAHPGALELAPRLLGEEEEHTGIGDDKEEQEDHYPRYDLSDLYLGRFSLFFNFLYRFLFGRGSDSGGFFIFGHFKFLRFQCFRFPHSL